MTGYARKTLILGFAVLLVTAFTCTFVWRAGYWQRAGWMGLVYQPAWDGEPDHARVLESLGPLARTPSEVLIVVPGGPAEKAGIESGDRIVAMEGVPPSDTARLAEVSQRVRSGDSIRVSYERDGKRSEVTVRLDSPYRSPFVVTGIAVDILVALAFLGISVLVFWMKPQSERALVFFFMSAAASALYFLAVFTETEFFDARGVFPSGRTVGSVALMAVYLFAGTVMANLLLHLALIFPKRRPIVERSRTILGWIHGGPFVPLLVSAALIGGGALSKSVLLYAGVAPVAAVAAALLTVRLARAAKTMGFGRAVARHPGTVIGAIAAIAIAISPAVRAQSGTAVFAFGVAIGVTVIFVAFAQSIVYSALTCIAMIRSYRESDVEEKHQVRWPLWGTVAAIGLAAVIGIVYFVLAVIEPSFLADHPVFPLAVGNALKLTYILIPVSFAFGILKYRLLDIDVIIRKTLVYAGVTGVILFAWLALVGIIGVVLVTYAGVRTPTVGVAATVAVALLLVPVRNRVQAFIDRRFYQRRADYQETIRLITHDISRATDLDATLKRAAGYIQQALRARTLLIFARDAAEGHFVLRAKVGIPDEHLGRARFAESDIAPAFREPLTDLASASLDAETAARLRHLGARFVARAQVRGETAGFLAAGARLTGAAYDQDDHEFLANAADQIALAIGNLAIRPEEIEYAEALEIQQSLLPSSMPLLPGIEISGSWEPARVVGGDYYDAVRFSDDRVALCIADVAGKGMPAALLMSSLQASVQAIAAPEFAPDEVCRRVRTLVCRSLTGGKFVTFFYAVVDATARTLTWCNAGHNPPLLIRADGTVTRLASGGGAFARLLVKSGFASSTVGLEPGDRIVLFTDGVSEARNAHGEEFGDDRLIALVREHRDASPEALQRTIVAAVKQFTDELPQDDVTLVVAGMQ